uniref:epididymal-specific lipocalin-12 n=1 Tax=Myxine glutinosa TaxID=7769 RepID=UPI00358F0404
MVSGMSLIFPVLFFIVIVIGVLVACVTCKCCYIKKRMCARRQAYREAHEVSHPLSSPSQPEASASIPSHSPQTSPWPPQPYSSPPIPYPMAMPQPGVPGYTSPIGFIVKPSMPPPGTYAGSVQEYPIGPAPYSPNN